MSTDSLWEHVFFVSSVHDGPRGGVALFRGRPHVFESEPSPHMVWDTDFFLLMEITPDLLALAVEEYELWEQGIAKTSRDADLERRSEELDRLIGNGLAVIRDRSVRVRAAFSDDPAPERLARFGLVRWLEVDVIRPPLPPIVGRRFSSGPLPNDFQRAMKSVLLGLVKDELKLAGAEALISEVNKAEWLLEGIVYDGASDDAWRKSFQVRDEAIGVLHSAVQAFAEGGLTAELIAAVRSVVEILGKGMLSEAR